MASPITFLKETQEELKKVTWPSREHVLRSTIIIIIICIIVGAFLASLDYVFSTIVEILVAL